MIICPNCGHQNLEGALFCERCGVALTAISVGTKKLGNEDSQLEAGGEQLDDEYIVFLHVAGYEDPITVQIIDQIVMGRTGGEMDNTPHLNLDTHKADELGVSRRHALLTRDGHRLFVTDLNSTNSTYINGQRLEPEATYVLRDGDEIRLGQLSMRLFFK
ncbi:MAG: FHA domain-containing protein [Chloroflexi bacterium]|jgi:hypothetical protein|nr:FHA domain-containing protein [Chloroflexota bacterium]